MGCKSTKEREPKSQSESVTPPPAAAAAAPHVLTSHEDPDFSTNTKSKKQKVPKSVPASLGIPTGYKCGDEGGGGGDSPTPLLQRLDTMPPGERQRLADIGLPPKGIGKRKQSRENNTNTSDHNLSENNIDVFGEHFGDCSSKTVNDASLGEDLAYTVEMKDSATVGVGDRRGTLAPGSV
eukprot:PhF_6_TR38887/c0_g1_i3/m.58166